MNSDPYPVFSQRRQIRQDILELLVKRTHWTMELALEISAPTHRIRDQLIFLRLLRVVLPIAIAERDAIAENMGILSDLGIGGRIDAPGHSIYENDLLWEITRHGLGTCTPPCRGCVIARRYPLPDLTTPSRPPPRKGTVHEPSYSLALRRRV